MIDSIQMSRLIISYIISCIVILLLLIKFTSIKINMVANIMLGILLILLGLQQENMLLMLFLIILGTSIPVYELMNKTKLKDSSITNPASWR
jgi:hypothetical protein